MLDFTGATIEVYPYNQEFKQIKLHDGASFICDENGELILVTNNCKVFDRDFNVVPGTDTLTSGVTFNNFCDQYGEYPTSQTSLILPELSNDSTFYIVHKDSELSNILQAKISKNLYLSILIRKNDGTFYLKETIALLNQEMMPGKRTTCINKEGVNGGHGQQISHNNTFYKFLIGGQDTVQGPFRRRLGTGSGIRTMGALGKTPLHKCKYMGMLTSDHKILLYDFDNESGRVFQLPDHPRCGR